MRINRKSRISRLFNVDASDMYRIFRNHDNKLIVVIRHEAELDATDFMRSVIGQGPKNYAYETKGTRIADFEATGTYRWTNKEVVSHIKRIIEQRGRY